MDDEDDALLRHLSELGLAPGVEVETLDAMPFDGPLTFRVEGRTCSAGAGVTRHVWVRAVGCRDTSGPDRAPENKEKSHVG